MTFQDVGTQYNQRSRRERPTNPSELLISLRKRYPADTKEQLLGRFRDRIRDDDSFVDATIDFWFSMHYGRLVEPPKERPAQPTAAQKTEQVERVKTTVKKRVVEAFLLDMELNGKKLRDMTGKECSRMGGWLSLVAEKVGPNQKVGDVLSEQQVKKLYG